MLSPEDDFETWAQILKMCTESMSQLKNVLPVFIAKMEEIVLNGQLSDPLADRSEYFVTDVAKNVVANVLATDNVYYDWITLAERVLVLAAQFVINAFSVDGLASARMFMGVFDPAAEIYLYRNNSKYYANSLWTAVEGVFRTHAWSLVKRIRGEVKTLSIEHFAFFYESVEKFMRPKPVCLDKEFAETLDAFLEFLNGLDDERIKEIDLPTMQKTATCFITVLGRKRDDREGDEALLALFTLGDRLLMSDVLPRQIVGGHILATAHDYDNMEEVYSQWAMSTRLREIVIERDLHPHLLEVIEKVVAGLLNADGLVAFAEKAEHVHVSGKGRVLNMMKACLKNMDAGQVRKCLMTLQEKGEVSLDFITLLGTSSITMDSNTSEMHNDIASALFDAGRDETKRDRVMRAVCEIMTGCQVCVHVALVMYTVERISEREYDPFVCTALLKMIRGMNSFQAFSFGQYQKVCHIIERGELPRAIREALIELLGCIIGCKQICLTPDIFRLVCVDGVDDVVWNFLTIVIENGDGDDMLDDEICHIITEEIGKNDMSQTTMKFAEFLMTFFMYINVKDERIRSSSRNKAYQVSRICEWPLLECDFLFRCYAVAASQEVSENIGVLMTDLLFNAVPEKHEVIVPWLVNFMKMSAKLGPNAETRVLSLITRYVERVELDIDPDRSGMPRHKPMKQRQGELHIRVLAGTSTFGIIGRGTTGTAKFKTRLAEILGLAFNEFAVYLSNWLVTSYRTLSEAGIRDGCTVSIRNVHGCSSVPRKCLFPTLVLESMGFCNVLLEKLSSSTDTELVNACQYLLKRLPSDSVVITSLDDMPEFVKTLYETKSDYVVGYKLRILIAHLGRYRWLFERENGCKFLVSWLLSCRAESSGTGQVLYLMTKLFGRSMTDRSSELIPKLMNMFTEKKHTKMLSSILYELAKCNDQSLEIGVNQYDAFITAVANLDDDSFDIFADYTRRLKDGHGIVSLCIEHINSHGDNMYFTRVAMSVIDTVTDVEQLDDILTLCMDGLAKASGKRVGMLCQIIVSIFKSSTEVGGDRVKLASSLLRTAFRTKEEDVRDSIFKLCQSVDLQDDADIDQFLLNIFDLHVDSWNYVPALVGSVVDGFIGLRNLGSTCYMNAILQQLFWTFPFRFVILTSEMKSEADQRLKHIFTELQYNSMRRCDTESFCKEWKGWGRRPIDPREQQDANEFMQLLLDQMPVEFHGMFKGEIENKVEGINESYESKNSEMFYSISLDVKGLANVMESFDTFVQSDMFVGENQYSIGDRKIDAKKSVHIKALPDVLVLQLKRFEYDLTTFRRVKVNDRYDFPCELNLQQYMIDGSVSYTYVLRGVVVHSGTADGGHYYSIIKVDEKWMEFNDADVSELSNSEFDQKVLGRGFDDECSMNMSAFMLFYVKKNGSVDVGGESLSFESMFDITDKCDASMVDDILKKNDEHVRMQAVFSQEMFKVAVKMRNPTTLLNYFFNVFCHGRMTAYTGSMELALENMTRNVSPDVLLDYILKHDKWIAMIFSDCGLCEVYSVFCGFVCAVLKRCAAKDGFKIVNDVIDALPVVMENSRARLSSMAGFLNQAMTEQSGFVELAKETGWLDKLISLISSIYETQRSQMVFQTMDLGNVFKIMTRLIDESDEKVTTILRYTQIQQSTEHGKEFVEFCKRLMYVELIDVQRFAKLLVSGGQDKGRYKQIIRALLELDDKQHVKGIIVEISERGSANITFKGLITKVGNDIGDGGRDGLNLVVAYPREFLFYALLHNNETVRQTCSYLVTAIIRVLKSDWNNTRFPTDLTQEEKQRVIEILYRELVPFIGELYMFPVDDVLPAHDTKCSPLGEFALFVRRFMTLVKTIGEDLSLAIVNLYYRVIAVRTDFDDCNLVAVIQTLGALSPSYWEDRFCDMYDAVFVDVEGKTLGEVRFAFNAFTPFFKSLLSNHMRHIVTRDTFGTMFHSILKTDNGAMNKVCVALCDRLVQENDGQTITALASVVVDHAYHAYDSSFEHVLRLVKHLNHLNALPAEFGVCSLKMIERLVAPDHDISSVEFPGEWHTLRFYCAMAILGSDIVPLDFDWEALEISIDIFVTKYQRLRNGNEIRHFFALLIAKKSVAFNDRAFNKVTEFISHAHTDQFCRRLVRLLVHMAVTSPYLCDQAIVRFLVHAIQMLPSTSIGYYQRRNVFDFIQVILVSTHKEGVPEWLKLLFIEIWPYNSTLLNPLSNCLARDTFAAFSFDECTNFIQSMYPLFRSTLSWSIVTTLFLTHLDDISRLRQLLPDRPSMNHMSQIVRDQCKIIYGDDCGSSHDNSESQRDLSSDDDNE